MTVMEQLNQNLTLSQCLGNTFSCTCGHIHTAALDAAEIGKDALEMLPSYMERFQWNKAFIVCDAVTQKIAGNRVLSILSNAGRHAQLHIITHTAFDESTLGELCIGMEPDCDAVIGVGTGAINDMCRYFSFKMDRPYCCVATAAPMDGFASSISALTVNHMKTTLEARTPKLIVGDTEILKNAPCRMISAGLGDLIGKFTCLCDWKLSRIINNEYYCETVVNMVDGIARHVLENAGRARERDPKVLGDIMGGLVFTGVAMSMIGNSRPASGCEHHISHYWETIFEQQGRRPVPHGLQVGVGTVLILMMTEALRSTHVDFEQARAAACAYDPAKWEAEIRRAYGAAADGVIALEHTSHKNAAEGRLHRIDVMEEKWAEITALLEALPRSQQVMDIITSLDAPCLPKDIDVDSKLLKDTLVYCKEIRARYTILQMIWDLGLTDRLSDQVIDKVY